MKAIIRIEPGHLVQVSRSTSPDQVRDIQSFESAVPSFCEILGTQLLLQNIRRLIVCQFFLAETTICVAVVPILPDHLLAFVKHVRTHGR